MATGRIENNKDGDVNEDDKAVPFPQITFPPWFLFDVRALFRKEFKLHFQFYPE